MRPTLYLTNLSSRKHHGPGRKVCAMANPRRFEQGDGRCSRLAPAKADLLAVQAGSMGLAEYRRRVEEHIRPDGPEDYGLAPGGLRFDFEDADDQGYEPGVHLRDGDTLFCACARPGSSRRRHPCHIELLPPFLVRAGWDVRIDGILVTMGEDGPVWSAGEGQIVVKQYGLQPYRAEAFGWPEAT